MLNNHSIEYWAKGGKTKFRELGNNWESYFFYLQCLYAYVKPKEPKEIGQNKNSSSFFIP